MENPIIVITLEDERKITLELYPDIAPISVENFLKLVDDKYFDGVVFHRIIEGFMIQTGGYKIEDNTLTELPETKAIKGEFASNGFEQNTLKHELGVISMARTGVKDSATSQFFICAATCPWLDGEYAAFGKVIDGMDNIKYIVANEPVANAQSGQLANNLTIKKAIVDLKGKTYKEVEKVTE